MDWTSALLAPRRQAPRHDPRARAAPRRPPLRPQGAPHVRDRRQARLSRRAKALLAGLFAAAAVGGGTVAVAGVSGLTRQDNGVVRTDNNGLNAWYQGRGLSDDQIEGLQVDGKAGGTAPSPSSSPATAPSPSSTPSRRSRRTATATEHAST